MDNFLYFEGRRRSTVDPNRDPKIGLVFEPLIKK